MSIVQTFSQTSGFLVPLIREVITRVEDSSVDYEEKCKVRWIWFFVLCGGVGLTGVLSVVIGFLGCSAIWNKHPSLEENYFEMDENFNLDRKSERKPLQPTDLINSRSI